MKYDSIKTLGKQCKKCGVWFGERSSQTYHEHKKDKVIYKDGLTKCEFETKLRPGREKAWRRAMEKANKYF